MSGTSLNDMAGVQEEVIEPTIEQPMEEQGGNNEFIKNILLAETGAGSIESYRDHAMNFNNSKSFAHILRGLTGVCGSLNLAVIDIGVGLLQYFKESRGLGANSGGDFPS